MYKFCARKKIAKITCKKLEKIACKTVNNFGESWKKERRKESKKSKFKLLHSRAKNSKKHWSLYIIVIKK